MQSYIYIQRISIARCSVCAYVCVYVHVCVFACVCVCACMRERKQ